MGPKSATLTSGDPATRLLWKAGHSQQGGGADLRENVQIPAEQALLALARRAVRNA